MAERVETVAPRSDEPELVRQAQRGDDTAFTALYQRYLNRIYRFLYLNTGDRLEAEDLTAQVFMKAWEKLHSYRERGVPFGAWLFRIARNTLIDEVRARRETESLDHPAAVGVTDGHSVEAEVDRRLLGEELARDLQELTSEQRQVIVMRLVEDYSTEEVARALNRRPGAIRGLQMRGLEALAGLRRRKYG